MTFRRASVALMVAATGLALGGLGSGMANVMKAAPAVEIRAETPAVRRERRGSASWSRRRLCKRGWSVAEGKRRSIKRHNQRRHKRQSRG